MIEQKEREVEGVTCLHCGLHTPLSNSESRGLSTQIHTMERPQVTIVRCTECGGEAPYLADEIVILKKVSRFAACAV